MGQSRPYELRRAPNVRPLYEGLFLTSTKLTCNGGMRLANNAPGNRSALHRKALGGLRPGSVRKSWTLAPSRKNDICSSRSGCPCRITSFLEAICLRTRPGTNVIPPAPTSHTGACHYNRRNSPCTGSLSTSAQTGDVLEGSRIAPVSTHLRSSADSCGTGGRIGRTRAW